jgi:Arc/MetJ-type ribon-helix-helix transcriptional regulator
VDDRLAHARDVDQGSYRGSITGVKVSVSLPDDDVGFLDDYARVQGLASRSAALQRAVRLLRAAELAPAYAAAWEEWSASGDERAWDAAVADGLS